MRDIENKLIKITKLPGHENYSRPNYNVPPGTTGETIEQHVKNAIGFAKEFNIEVSFVDKIKGINLNICPTCKLEEFMNKGNFSNIYPKNPTGKNIGAINISSPLGKQKVI